MERKKSNLLIILLIAAVLIIVILALIIAQFISKDEYRRTSSTQNNEIDYEVTKTDITQDVNIMAPSETINTVVNTVANTVTDTAKQEDKTVNKTTVNASTESSPNENTTKEKTPEEIAKELYEQLLKDTGELEEYRIENVSIETGARRQELIDNYYEGAADSDIFAVITYSVKPKSEYKTGWTAGDGIENGEWITNKGACAYIVKTNNTYTIKSSGTGW